MSPINAITTSLPIATAPAPSVDAAGPSFGSVFERILSGAGQSHAAAESAVRDLALGQTDNLHGVLMQVAQADLSFRLMLEIRNRLIDAYQDIMKMQI